MNTDNRWTVWNGLQPEVKELLELISLVYVPRPKKHLLQLFDGYRRAKNESPRNMEGIVPQLRKSGLLCTAGSLMHVAYDMIEDISCAAVVSERAALMCSYLQKNLNVREQTDFAQARLALYSHDADDFFQLLEDFEINQNLDYRNDEDVVKTICRGFLHPDSMERVPDAAAFAVCEQKFLHSVNKAQPCAEEWEWYRARSAELPNHDWYRHQYF